MRLGFDALLLAAGFFAATTALATGTDAEKLDALARQFWAAEVRQEWGTVYDMLSLPERDSEAREQYVLARTQSGPLHYKAAQVDQVSALDDVAWVHVSFEFTLPRQPWVAPRRGQTWQIWEHTDRWRAVPPDGRDQWPALPPQLRPAEDEAALAGRTLEYWQARAAQDWRSVYQYLSPDYRAQVPLERFLRSKAKNLYIAPRVKWAEVKGDSGRVRVTYLYKYADRAASKMEPVEGGAIESWVRVDGKWFLDVPPPPKDDDEPSDKSG